MNLVVFKTVYPKIKWRAFTTSLGKPCRQDSTLHIALNSNRKDDRLQKAKEIYG